MTPYGIFQLNAPHKEIILCVQRAQILLPSRCINIDSLKIE